MQEDPFKAPPTLGEIILGGILFMGLMYGIPWLLMSY